MKTSTILRLGTLVLLVGVLSVPSALAQIPEYSTMPIDEPTDVGGTILQPGTYLIRVLPGFSNRNRVQITSPDRETIYTTVLTVPHAIAPTEEMPNTMFVFYPAFEGQPRALRTWFAPDPVSKGGHDIVYEESRAKQLARASRSSVVAYRGEMAADMGTTELEVVTPEATIQPYVVPEPPRVAVVTPPPPPPPPAPMIAETRRELPRTAGNTPLIALLGLLSLAGAVAFRAFTR
jgi:hypothetical protein